MIGSELSRLARIAACVLLLAGAARAAESPEQGATIYRNAQVWTGDSFVTMDLAVKDARFMDPRKAGRGAREVAVGGRFIVPAYANAHTHVTLPSEEFSRLYLQDGVFYVWNPNTNVIPLANKAFFARPDTYDVAIAQGGITGRGGHPEKLFTRFVFPGRSVESLVGDALHYGDTPAEIDAALDKLVEQGADFVKGYLAYSEEYSNRHGKAEYWGLHGMNPEYAHYLVKAAKKRGLEVVFHTETLVDLRIAIKSGARAAMHMPAYGPGFSDSAPEKWALTDADAREMAQRGMMVVTTAGLMNGFDGKLDRGALGAKQRLVQAENLRLLAKNGVPLLVGTDNSIEVFAEAEHLSSLKAFTPAELLKIILGTGRHLFPKRRIGCFQPGCEADFLILRDNPLADIKALRSIDMRIKAGRPMH
jgi:imidazolonepropionase-like amidohydrolase